MPKRKRKQLNQFHGEMAATGAWKLYEGVKKQKDGFRAQITIEGKLQNLGTFDTPKEAAQAYDRAAIQAGRSTSDLNFS